MTHPIFGDVSYFAIIRHGDKETGDDPGLTEKGRLQAQKAGLPLKEFLCDKLGKQKIALVTSTLRRSQETAHWVAEKIGIPTSEVKSDPRIRERVKGSLPKENSLMRTQRMKECIEETLMSLPQDTVPVFVSHSIIEHNFRKRITGETNQDLLHHLKCCDAAIYRKEGDQYSILAVIRSDFV